jgi:hypothetical protein
MFHLFRKAQQIDSILRQEIWAGTNSAVSGIFFPDANKDYGLKVVTEL